MIRHGARFAVIAIVTALSIAMMVPPQAFAGSGTDDRFPTTYRTDIPPIEPTTGEAYGLGLQWTFIPAIDWEPEQEGMLVSRSAFDGRIMILGGNVMAPVRLPFGSEIHQICFVVYDPFSAAMWSKLSLYVVESADDDVGNLQFLELGSTGTTLEEYPGWTQRCVTFPDPVILKSWGDVDDDGTEHYLAYHLRAEETGSGNLGLHMAVITWNRTISPAPAIATFPDVLPGHWSFQFVEALAASGITQGFPDGTFRPTEPTTRAQMATFLARALGLHRPGVDE